MIGSVQHSTRFAHRVGYSQQPNRLHVRRGGRSRRPGPCTIRSAAITQDIQGDVVKLRPKNPKFATVLSIDGGGVRGLIPAVVLQSVEKAIIDYIKENDLLDEDAKGKDIQVDMADYFDVISGTSVGSIVALYLASKGGECEQLFKKNGWDVRAGSVAGVVKLIQEKADEVFPTPWYKGIPVIDTLFSIIRIIFWSKHSEKGVERLLQDAFGDLTLKNVYTGLVVPTFELTRKQAFSFWSTKDDTGFAAVKPRAEPKNSTTLPAKSGSSNGPSIMPSVILPGDDPIWDADVEFVGDKDFRLWQVARASSAAPTFFSSSSFGPIGGGPREEKTFIDGGVIANNPTLQAVAFIETRVNCPIENLAILSLGTGHALPKTNDMKAKAGMVDWILSGNLISILMDGSSEYLQSLVDLMFYQVKKLPAGQYVRISTCVGEDDEDTDVLSEMDNPEHVPRLTEIGTSLGEGYEAAIREFVEEFIFTEAAVKAE